MDYDSSRAAQFMRSKDLPTQFLVAKLRLQDLDINVNDSALAQLCVTVSTTGGAYKDGPETIFDGSDWSSQTKTKQKIQKWTSHLYFWPVLISPPLYKDRVK